MKSQIMFKFLFWLILGLVIFIPTVMFGAKFLKVGDKSVKSFWSLADVIGTIKDGEVRRSTGVYMEEQSFIVGFSKDSKRFEHYNYDHPAPLVYFFEKPADCKDMKACICICKDYDVDIVRNSPPYSSPCIKPVCTTFNNIDFLAEKTVVRYGDGRPRDSWKNGFLYLRADVPAIVNGLPQNQMATRTFYVEREKGLIGVCLERPCISDEEFSGGGGESGGGGSSNDN